MNPPRVLLITEEANPEWVSVPLEGWSHARALAEVADVHQVTQVRNRPAFLRAGLEEGRDFTAIDSEALAHPLWRLSTALRGGADKGWTTVTALKSIGYWYFEQLVWGRFAGDLTRGRFDLVHRLTPLSPTAPSPLAARCRRAGVPFVLGPLNGGLPWPAGFDQARRQEREWGSYVRSAHRLLPGYRATRRHAAALISGSRDTLAEVPAAWRHKCIYVPENGIDPARFSAVLDQPVALPLRLAFVGRLVPYKGPDMLLEAAGPLVREGQVTIDIIGDGPLRGSLRRQVETDGLAAGVRMEGWVEHERLQYRIRQSDCFAFPSVREFGGGVVLEAMALGLVPIVVDYGGPGELVTETTGFRIPIGPRDRVVAELRRVLLTLVHDPRPLRDIGRRARQRVLSQFTWAAKARQVMEVYRWVLGRRPDRPDFGMPLPDSPASPTESEPHSSAAPPSR
jgi:glycosyltransferase involved in cell wall biosynthesis